MNSYRTLLILVSCILGSSAIATGPRDPKFWSDRDARLAGTTFTYRLDVQEAFALSRPVPAATVNLEHSVVTMPGVDGGWEYRRTTRVQIRRSKEGVEVRGELPGWDTSLRRVTSLPLRLYFGTGVAGGLEQVPSGGSLKDGFFTVVNSPGGIASDFVPGAGLLIGGPHNVFLMGTNPFDVCGLTWSAAPRVDGGFDIAAANYTGIGDVTNFRALSGPVDITYHSSSDGKLTGAEMYASRKVPINKLPVWTVRVAKWRRVNGVSVPSDLTLHVNRDLSGRHYSGFTDYHWSLLDASVTPSPAAVPIPKGTGVADWRLAQPAYMPGNSPPRDQQPVFYKWTGRFPSLDELRQMRAAAQPERPTASILSRLLSFGIPTLLILIGIYLVYRERKRPPRRV